MLKNSSNNTAATDSGAKKRRRAAIPGYLVKEVLDGIPVYYKGYRDVMRKAKTPEEITADGLLQATIKFWLTMLLGKRLDLRHYWIVSGEVGMHISHKNNFSHDLMVIEKSALPPERISNRYADVPAKLVVEVDTEIEYGDALPTETYIHRKTQQTLDFGTERVVWIFTATQKMMVAARGQDWVICGWDKSVELIDGIQLNMMNFLAEAGVMLDRPEEA